MLYEVITRIVRQHVDVELHGMGDAAVLVIHGVDLAYVEVPSYNFV